MKIGILEAEFIIYKSIEIPKIDENIFCLIQEKDGMSIVALKENGNSQYSPIFKAFYLDELDDFSQSGILYKILKPLKENNISVLVLSAFNRDYIFIDKDSFPQALNLIKGL
ncbi:ACT domain-containing protein [Helicobacter sp. MIT 05-5294]|uniref:ACT domain-containing protein n=1 Tax=Helicobacter sp. MIT 05-5294 TaxID=1548150 RepID=UPI00051F947E|nr:ACT domain-containing protein [Helicobacter sp. MIT 05-5294]TLD85461.1 ACT domain-containing protein [Helicobacter sp. MIT 05-5294]